MVMVDNDSETRLALRRSARRFPRYLASSRVCCTFTLKVTTLAASVPHAVVV